MPKSNADLVDRFRDDVAAPFGRRFIEELDEWSKAVHERTFEFNIIEVIVNFDEGWAQISDVLESDRSHRLPLDDLRAIFRGAQPA